MRKTIFLRKVKTQIWQSKSKLFVVFLMILTTTALLLSFFVGTSSVLYSITHFNEHYFAESGNFITLEEVSSNIHYEQMRFVDVELFDQTMIRVFSQRESINLHQVTSGADLSEPHDILLDANFMIANHLELQAFITIEGQDFQVVGQAISPDYVATKNSEWVLQANSERFGIAFLKRETFESLFSPGQIQFYYSYISEDDIRNIARENQVLHIQNAQNNSRMMQVIGDAEAPMQLSILIVIVFYTISTILLIVFHLDQSKKEKNNLQTFKCLGIEKKKLFLLYSLPTNILIFISSILGIIIGKLFIETILLMNSALYNYPLMRIQNGLLIATMIIAILLPLLINSVVVSLNYLGDKRADRKRRLTRFQKKIYQSKMNDLMKLRLLKMLRTKKEVFVFAFVILFIGLLINFSFLLKFSVEQYVIDLGVENQFEVIYFVNEGFEDLAQKDHVEHVRLFSLFDENDIMQRISLIGEDSLYFDEKALGEVTISQAFSLKYGKGVGDVVTLYDMARDESFALTITHINEATTTSEIYIMNDTLLEGSHYQHLLVSNQAIDQLEEANISRITRDEMITSGRNILRVIDRQITLIIGISMIVELVLVYSLFEFILQNNKRNMRILRLNGFSLKELFRIHFMFNGLLMLVIVIGSYGLARWGVRAFLDSIMFTFINYVVVVDHFLIVLLSNGIVIAIYGLLYGKIRLKIKRLMN